jgi:prepilin-type processing-associated H-X9-DG protein
MPEFSVLLESDGEVTKNPAPHVSELVFTKLVDCSSKGLFDPGSFFVADGTGNIPDGTSNSTGHTGGVNAVLCDGSVRFLDTSVGSVFGDFHLV